MRLKMPRQAMRVIPLIHTRVARPALIVERVAALENHAVYAAGTAEDLTPSVEKIRRSCIIGSGSL